MIWLQHSWEPSQCGSRSLLPVEERAGFKDSLIYGCKKAVFVLVDHWQIDWAETAICSRVAIFVVQRKVMNNYMLLKTHRRHPFLSRDETQHFQGHWQTCTQAILILALSVNIHHVQHKYMYFTHTNCNHSKPGHRTYHSWIVHRCILWTSWTHSQVPHQSGPV